MIVKDIMTRDVGGVIPEDNVKLAAHKMRSLNVGVLPVCDGKKLQGIITDRDIVTRSTAEGNDPSSIRVKDIMSTDLRFCLEDETVEEAAKKMETRQIRRMPVLNQEKQLVGIVSLGDIAVREDNKELAGEVLEKVSEPDEPRQK